MDAHFFRSSFLRHLGVLLPILFLAMGASYETANFTVHAPTVESARQFADTAEQCRRDLAILWLGTTLPDWSEKCPVIVHVGEDLGAGGRTSFVFENGEVFDWEMEIQGSHERILDSVLPHEITHMILASHFRKPVPRWLDEGMATSVEHNSEKANYRRMLQHFLQSNVRRCLPLNRLVAMKDYPSGDPMPFYAQGFSLAEYLIEIGREFDENEHRRLVQFAQCGSQTGDWKSALQEYYGIENLGELQLSWIDWVDNGATLPMLAEVPNVRLLDGEAAANVQVPVALTSARPPSGKSVYDRRDETPKVIPDSFGRNVVVR